MGSSASAVKGEGELDAEGLEDDEEGPELEAEGGLEGFDDEEEEGDEEEESEEGLLMTWNSWEEVAETETGGWSLRSSMGRMEGSEDRRLPSLLQSKALLDLFLTSSGVGARPGWPGMLLRTAADGDVDMVFFLGFLAASWEGREVEEEGGVAGVVVSCGGFVGLETFEVVILLLDFDL